jgi:hypothetical protein
MQPINAMQMSGTRTTPSLKYLDYEGKIAHQDLRKKACINDVEAKRMPRLLGIDVCKMVCVQMRRDVWLSSLSARSNTFSELEPWPGANLGVLGTVACAAAPRAALSGVAGTPGVP